MCCSHSGLIQVYSHWSHFYLCFSLSFPSSPTVGLNSSASLVLSIPGHGARPSCPELPLLPSHSLHSPHALCRHIPSCPKHILSPNHQLFPPKHPYCPSSLAAVFPLCRTPIHHLKAERRAPSIPILWMLLRSKFCLLFNISVPLPRSHLQGQTLSTPGVPE